GIAKTAQTKLAATAVVPHGFVRENNLLYVLIKTIRFCGTRICEIRSPRNCTRHGGPDPVGQTPASLLRIAFARLISKLRYAAPEIHNFCRYIAKHLASAFLSILRGRSDFRTGRQLQSGCAAYRFGECECRSRRG